MARRIAALAVSASLALAPALAAGASPATPLGGETPQAVVARLGMAMQTKDVSGIVASLDAKSRTEFAMGLLMASAMVVAFAGMGSEMAGAMAGMSDDPKARAEAEQGRKEAAAKTARAKAALSAVFKANGLPDLMDDSAPKPEGDPEAMLAKVDQPRFVADLMEVMATLGDKKAADATPSIGPSDKLPDMANVTGYEITGDTATAKAGKEDITFVKENGRWFLKAPESKDKGGEKE